MTILSRRHLLGGATAAAALPAASRAAAPAPLAIVMNSGESSLSVIDMNTRKVVNTVATLREPSHWALTPDRTALQIADASGNALFSIDPITAAPKGHIRIPDPYQLGYSPDEKWLAINCLRLDLIQIYRASDMSLALSLRSPSMPSHLDFTPDSRWSFHSMQGSNDMVSIDLTTMKERWRKPVGTTPAGVLWHRGRILCCIMGSDHIVELDPVSGEITRRAKVGIGPHNVFLSPDRGTLYVSNRIGGTLAAIDPVTFAVRRVYDMHHGGPDDIGIAPDGKIWIALRFHGAVAVLDPASGNYETIRTGRSPHGIFLNTQMAKSGLLTAETL